MDDIDVGKRLKDLRAQRKMTLQQVADAAELSKSFVSQVETGSAKPSIGSLKRIADVLEITLAELFQEDEPSDPSTVDRQADGNLVRVVKGDRRKHLQWPNGAEAALLTPDLQGKLEVLLTTYDPARELQIDPYTHEGEEFGLVLEGRFEVVVDGVSYALDEGDSIYFPSHLPHYTRAVGDEPVRTLWVITPPSF